MFSPFLPPVFPGQHLHHFRQHCPILFRQIILADPEHLRRRLHRSLIFLTLSFRNLSDVFSKLRRGVFLRCTQPVMFVRLPESRTVVADHRTDGVPRRGRRIASADQPRGHFGIGSIHPGAQRGGTAY